MEKARKLATTIRNNWKKSVFFTGAAVYGARWYNKRLEDNAYMTELSREALTYGTGLVQGASTPLYRVTVILNPVASGGKGRKLYEKYCAPLLNLAGMKVSIIRTESDGQAKDIMEIMADADAVLVAGGDGTLMEAVTGLLRRSDKAEAVKIPIGVLPVGRTNSMAHRLFGVDDDVRLMGEATMSVVRHLKKPMGVIEVENRSEDERFQGKKMFCLNRVEIGAWKDARLRTDRYWLFGFGLKNYITYLGSYTSGHKDVFWDCDFNLQYVEEEEAVNSDLVESTSNAGDNKTSSSWSNWLLGGRKQETIHQSKSENNSASDSASVVNWLDRGTFNGAQMTIENFNDKLQVILHDQPLDFYSFVNHGWSLWKNRFSCQILNPNLSVMNPTLISTSQVLMSPNLGEVEGEGKVQKMCLDGDEVPFDAPVKLSYLKDQILVFCDKTEAISEPKASPESSSKSLSSRWGGVKSSFIKSKNV